MAQFKDWLLGPIRPRRSSWVSEYGYGIVGRRAGVIVRFKDHKGKPTVTAFYPDADGRDYEDMKNAKSKGKYVHRRLYDLDYELI
jgi:hypothetical protein